MNPIHLFTLGYSQEYLFIGIIFGVIIGAYSYFRVKYALSGSGLSKNKKLAIPFIIPILVLVCCLNIWSTAAILVFYLFLSSIIADVIRIIWKYLSKDKYLNFIPKYHKKGVLALIIFVIIIIGGVYGMNHIELTEYNLTTNKIDNKPYSIVWVSDVHYGSIQSPHLVKESISKINDLKPDIVVLGGDIVDERTSKEDMNEIFKELGQINSTYGVYYVFGNHDNQPSSTDYENGNRTFSDEELIKTIKDNGIKILCDEKTTINNDVVLVGRSDAQWDGVADRVDVSKILNESDLSKYVVVLDHQPIDYEKNSQQGVDLQISGHTHGGQVFPFSIIYSKFMGILVYGEYHFGKMEQIVSSGLTGWGYPMRNEAKCEYVLININ